MQNQGTESGGGDVIANAATGLGLGILARLIFPTIGLGWLLPIMLFGWLASEHGLIPMPGAQRTS